MFVTEIAPREQVAAGLTTGATLQERVTVEGSSPPDGMIVIVDFAELPAVTEGGASAEEDRVKPGTATTRVTVDEALALKLLSPE